MSCFMRITLLMVGLVLGCGRTVDGSSEQDSGDATAAESSGSDETSIGAADTSTEALPPGCPMPPPAANRPVECPSSLVGTVCIYECRVRATMTYKCVPGAPDFPYPIWYNERNCHEY